MPVFLCRWENGDFSIVKAANKEQAIEFLDEVGNAENQPITALTDFMVHFVLTDDGDFELQSYGEETYEHVMRLGYPVLDKTPLKAPTDKTGGVTAEGKETIRQAVKKERERVSPRRAKSPKTQLG